MYNNKLGIIGGFGAYATLGFYKKILEEFATDCERNYPHIIMDNDFTMPSRTRALLYNEEYDTVVNMISNSLKILCDLNVDYIVLVCGTAHAFLDDAYKIVPQARKKVVNMISTLNDYFASNNHSEDVLVIAAEGTLKQNVYGKGLSNCKMVISPEEDQYSTIRYFIEAVKTNKVDKEVYDNFISFLKKYPTKNIILGCTEFPVLIDEIIKYDKDNVLSKYNFIDPLHLLIKELKNKMV